MPKITVKDKFGETKTYAHEALKSWRDGEMVEVYYNRAIDGGRDTRKVVLWCGHQPAGVEHEEEALKAATAPTKRSPDEFTEQDLKATDTPEEKEVLNQYLAIGGKIKKEPAARKRRTKAALKNAEAKKEPAKSIERPDPLGE